MAESLHISSGTGGLPKFNGHTLTFDLFYGEVKFASLYGKNVENFKPLLLWSLWANLAQISFGAFLGQGNERLLKWVMSIDQDVHHAHI